MNCCGQHSRSSGLRPWPSLSWPNIQMTAACTVDFEDPGRIDILRDLRARRRQRLIFHDGVGECKDPAVWAAVIVTAQVKFRWLEEGARLLKSEWINLSFVLKNTLVWICQQKIVVTADSAATIRH